MNNQELQETQKQTEEDLRSEFERTVQERVNRYLEIGHQWIIGAHHFAQASTECLLLYRDGHFIAVVMMSQAINEAIIKFVAERNSFELSLPKEGAKPLDTLIEELKQTNKISGPCAEASMGIWKSFRSDVHHMNPAVAKIDFGSLASINIRRLAAIETEIFGVDIADDGGIKPHNPIYWDAGKDGYASGYLRLRHP